MLFPVAKEVDFRAKLSSSSQQKLNIVDRFNRDRQWWCRTTENCREINENYTLGHTILAYRRIGRRPSPSPRWEK